MISYLSLKLVGNFNQGCFFSQCSHINIFRYHAISETADFAFVSFTRPEMAVRCWNTTNELHQNSKS